MKPDLLGSWDEGWTCQTALSKVAEVIEHALVDIHHAVPFKAERSSCLWRALRQVKDARTLITEAEALED